MSQELEYNKPWILQRADPYVYKHTDGTYYFTASIPAYDGIVLRHSDTLAGLKDAEKGIYGPGHNSFTEDEQGNPIMVYHARTEEKIEGNPLYNPNRHAMLMKLTWGEDGRPFFKY